MHQDESGAPAMAVNPLDDSLQTLDRLRDLIMLKLASRRMSQKSIAYVMRMSQQNVSRRLREIPPHVKTSIKRQQLDGLL